jgi:hypothetical protein
VSAGDRGGERGQDLRPVGYQRRLLTGRLGPPLAVVRLDEGTEAMKTLAAAAVVLNLAAVGCHGGAAPAFTQLAEARRLADDLQIELTKASNASDRAVMADTDEESITYAREADRAASIVEIDTAALGTRLANLGYAAERGVLQDFAARFAEYRQVDRDVLGLAVQNTNLKAQRLSFGPVREAADGFVTALETAAHAAPAMGRCRADGLAARGALAVREIQILQAPHIAAADDRAMAEIESQIDERQSSARAAKLDVAWAALDRLDKLSAELVALSRRNSNVRSLALSLRRTPQLIAACDGTLARLQSDLAKEGFSGTR